MGFEIFKFYNEDNRLTDIFNQKNGDSIILRQRLIRIMLLFHKKLVNLGQAI